MPGSISDVFVPAGIFLVFVLVPIGSSWCGGHCKDVKLEKQSLKKRPHGFILLLFWFKEIFQS